MKKIALLDDTFLRLETRKVPLHIGMLMLFEPPAGAPETFAYELAEKLREFSKTVPPFNQRLVEKKGGHYWEDDADFDLDKHFVHLALPRPGRIRELLAMVSRVHSAHLDRSYPLWTFYLIEGIEDGRIAVYLKVHHSITDGVTGIQMVMDSMSNDAELSKSLPPIWCSGSKAVEPGATMPGLTPASIAVKTLRRLKEPRWKSWSPLVKQLRQVFNDYRKKNPNLALAGQAPDSILNSKISASRRLAAQSYSATRVRAVARACDATSNDVLLTMIGSALKNYLAELGEHHKESLLAAVPVSTRRQGHKSEAANEVAFTIAHLATSIENPIDRVKAIKASMDYNKERLKELSPSQTLAFAALLLVPGAWAAFFEKGKTAANVCVSHVPGPREDMYWQGAKLNGIYPVSLILDYAALNITIISRHDNIDFGILACRKTLPSVQRILSLLEDALVELEDAVSKLPDVVPPSKGKPTTKAKKVPAATALKKKKVPAKKKVVAKKKPPAKKVST